jgi:4-amino-4-deoxy-L-arabinose transferase-like glycosyltransferase
MPSLETERLNSGVSAASRPGTGRLALAVLVLAGLAIRLFQAEYRFLNADEALHYLLSVQTSFAAAYRASLTTAHPPLLIIFLHYWGMLGHSELVLRTPCVVAGVLFCWIVFCWLRRVTDSSTALMGLTLLLFSPSLVQLSAEVRQYSFLLLFCATALYCLERAIAEDSIPMLCASGVALYLALLTHYSSLIFATTLGVYGLIRFSTARVRGVFMLAWAGVQAGGVAVASLLYATHLSKIRKQGMAESILDSYLSRSVLHPGQNALWFIGRSNLRLFHYFFDQGAAGVVGLLLFIAGVILLFRNSREVAPSQASPRQLAFLLLFPFIVNCVLGLFAIYPYGGTRHDSYLSIFAFSGMAIGLARWKPARTWWKPGIVGAVLLICNFFPAPIDQYIRLRDQKRELMQKAVEALNSTPTNSLIFTDDQGGLLLSYYLCHSKVVQIEEHSFKDFMRSPCGDRTVISINPDEWIFKAGSFPETMQNFQQTYNLKPGTQLWLFQAGWFVDKEFALREELKHFGCVAPQEFGRNMFLCTVQVSGTIQ